MNRTRVAIIGSGNIGTDLMIKILRVSPTLEVAAMVGIDPASDGLARARRLGVPTTSDGVRGLVEMPGFDEIEIVLDATSAAAHKANEAVLRPYGKRLVDLTPAALGPYVVPSVNLDAHLDAPNVNMVTCGGQATIPIVAAVAAVTPVHYGEIVASIASRSAGPGTRANIDEFTETTRLAIEQVGGAARGKAVIVLNPAEPPMIMRDTVLCLVDEPDQQAIADSVRGAVEAVRAYVPGYRLKQEVQFSRVGPDEPVHTLGPVPRTDPDRPTQGRPLNLSQPPLAVRRTAGSDAVRERRAVQVEKGSLWRVSIFLEVEGAAHYLPAYAGNLDIMTSAALRVAERLAATRKVAPR